MIEFWSYSLRSRGALNAVSERRDFRGALIRVDGGVGCLHPWPEFGDAPVEEQLRLLRDGGSSGVIERALRMAAVDGEFRGRGVSVFGDLEMPPSHYSWDQNQPVELQVRRVVEEGWRAVKMKGSVRFDDTVAAAESLPVIDRDPPGPGGSGDGARQAPLLRVDFNSCLTASQFAEFMRALPGCARERLDFVEDPFPYDAAAWSAARRDLGVRFACDKGLARTGAPRDESAAFDVAVLKPGRREWRGTVAELPPETRIVMTSAMDHAIGQSFAAYEAATAWRALGARLDLCGLCTEHLFERDAFFERMSSRGGLLRVDREGTGLGFDGVLRELEWRKL